MPLDPRQFPSTASKLQALVYIIVQELCESRGGRPGLSVLTSFLVSVDVKIYWTVLRHWSHNLSLMATDIWSLTSSSTDWFTTYFLGERCRKAMLGVWTLGCVWSKECHILQILCCPHLFHRLEEFIWFAVTTVAGHARVHGLAAQESPRKIIKLKNNILTEKWIKSNKIKYWSVQVPGKSV